jgi:hypothetical protein
MKKAIAILALASLFLSCRMMKPETIYITKDSLVTKTETVIKDSIIRIPGDTIRIAIPIRDTVFIVKGARSSSTVQVRSGKIAIQTACDEKDIIISKLRSEVMRFQAASSDSVRVEVKKIKHVPTYYKVISYMFWIVAALLAALIISNQNLWIVIVTTAAGLIRSVAKKPKKDNGSQSV